MKCPPNADCHGDIHLISMLETHSGVRIMDQIRFFATKVESAGQGRVIYGRQSWVISLMSVSPPPLFVITY